MPWIACVVCCLGALIATLRLSAFTKLRPRRVHHDVSQVSIIVPARNEAHNLPTLLSSLASLSPRPGEVIVVNDQSSDDTAAVARSFDVRVVEAGAAPPGVIGKSWACTVGAREATGALLLFTDADTWHAPDSLGKSVATLLDEGADLLSLVPTHRLVSAWEKLQGAFQLLLLVATASGARARSDDKRRFAIGQYLLFQRRCYEAIGGHTRVYDRLAEDMGLAENAAKQGFSVRLLFAPGALLVRMYPEGFPAFLAGWRRSFRDGMRAAGAGAALELFLVIGFLLGPLLWTVEALLRGASGWAALFALVYALSALSLHGAQRKLGAFPAWSAPLYQLFVGVFVWVSLRVTIDRVRKRDVTWRGRTIRMDG